ncbi:MAG: RpiB/LacA/LacB family sugar-phosphate isomerase [Spirochaetaceae bacterium]|jgi:ribose 5-phosphate isomerase RpiB|nr:RpiB/LacA/LacB family sugar-phosphate isomerase [Spirochaetaceae bacterium]
MKIAVITDTSTAAKNGAVMGALAAARPACEVFNLGQKGNAGESELFIYETAFLSALVLNLRCVDFVIGGCGTGQGYLNCVLQFPGVTCGLILEAVDAWLFPRINNGNCVSLALNKGYGWAGEKNLEFIFEKLFSGEGGEGYPPERRVPQQKIRGKISALSLCARKDFAEIIRTIDGEIFENVTRFPGVMTFIKEHAQERGDAYNALLERK